jgi:hypothetical protein
VTGRQKDFESLLKIGKGEMGSEMKRSWGCYIASVWNTAVFVVAAASRV